MTIAGYQFHAEFLCPFCMEKVAKARLTELGDATMWGDCGDSEQLLRAWANLEGIDRKDEATFDSGNFPKVVHAEGNPFQPIHQGCTLSNGYEPGQCNDTCAMCHNPLGDEDCPNGYTFEKAMRVRANLGIGED